MKHIEASRKIELSKDVTAGILRDAMIEHLERFIEVESITEGDSRFKIKGTTGAPTGITRHARVDLDVTINCESKDKIARILISGYARPARSLTIMYSFAFLLLLLVGLLPGFYETSQEDSGAVDALFFLIFGIFIIFDVNSKLSITKDHLETTLESLDTTFG